MTVPPGIAAVPMSRQRRREILVEIPECPPDDDRRDDRERDDAERDQEQRIRADDKSGQRHKDGEGIHGDRAPLQLPERFRGLPEIRVIRILFHFRRRACRRGCGRPGVGLRRLFGGGMIHSLILLFSKGSDMFLSEGRDDLPDGAVVVEFEFVDADFAVESRSVHDLAVLLPREPVVHDAPFVVRAVHLQNLVVSGAEDALRRVLLDHDVVARDGEVAERGIGGGVADMVVRAAGVVDGPAEIILAVAVDHVRALAEGSAGPERLHGVAFHAEHVVGELAARHVAVAPVKVILAAHGIAEDVRVDLLSAAHARGLEVDDGPAGVDERSERIVGDRDADALPAVTLQRAAEIEIVFVRTVGLLALHDARGPCVAAGPLHVFTERQDGAFVLPVLQVGRGEDLEIPAAPAGEPVVRGVDVVFAGLFGVERAGVGVERLDDRVVLHGRLEFRGLAPCFDQGVQFGARDGNRCAEGRIEAEGETSLRGRLPVFCSDVIPAAVVGEFAQEDILSAVSERGGDFDDVACVEPGIPPGRAPFAGEGRVGDVLLLSIEEHLILAVGRDDDRVDRQSAVALDHEPRFALEIREVVIRVRPVNLVVVSTVPEHQREIDQILLRRRVVDRMRRRNLHEVLDTGHVRESFPEVDGFLRPADQVVGLHEQEAASGVRGVAERGHVRSDHAEPAVFGSNQVRHADADGAGGSFLVNERHPAVEREELASVLADRVADLRLLRAVSFGVDEKPAGAVLRRGDRIGLLRRRREDKAENAERE